MSYYAQVEWMDEKEFKQFNKELPRDPTRGPLSRGTMDLLGVMGGLRQNPTGMTKR